MTFDEAMQLIADATASVQADRRTHQAIVQAIDTIYATVKEKDAEIARITADQQKVTKIVEQIEAEQDEAVN